MHERDKTYRQAVRDAAIATGLAVAGAAVGAVAATTVGDPVLAKIASSTVGAAVSNTLQWARAEFAQRALAAREQHRVRTVLELAGVEILERLDAGEAPRSDDFFEDLGDGRSTADEIAEGVLLVAQRLYEERKAPFIAALFTSFVFSPPIAREHANELIRLADQLSYCQLCLLALFTRRELFEQSDKTTNTGRFDANVGLRELYDLLMRNLVWNDSSRHPRSRTHPMWTVPPPRGPVEVRPSLVVPTMEGRDLHRRMRLDRINSQELMVIAESLKQMEVVPEMATPIKLSPTRTVTR